jgi:hypothetical protein
VWLLDAAAIPRYPRVRDEGIIACAMSILAGTAEGLFELTADGARSIDALGSRRVTALARDGRKVWGITDGRQLWESEDGSWTAVRSIESWAATCLAPARDGLLIGTEEAHLVRITDAGCATVEPFERVEGRARWHTPWGAPANVRSIATGTSDAIYVNVHVGGVVRSRDRGRSWTPTLDIDRDVHEVLALEDRPGWILVAAAVGFGISRDGGSSWEFITDGLHAHYLRAVAVSGTMALVSASTGPRGSRAAIYRRRLDGPGDFERCGSGLPEWFDRNIDTACLAAQGPRVVFGTADGRIFRSEDGGDSWELAARGLPAVCCIAVR